MLCNNNFKNKFKMIDIIMSYSPTNNQSWLDPSGNFHPIDRKDSGDGFLTHEQWAKNKGYKLKGLYKKGWLRIKKYGDTLWASNAEKVPPNYKQERELQNWASENPVFKKISFDNGEKEIIIWSRLSEYYEVNFKEWFDSKEKIIN